MKIAAVFLFLSTLFLASNGKIGSKYTAKFPITSVADKSVYEEKGNIINPANDEVDDAGKYVTQATDHKGRSHHRENKHGHHGHEENRDSNHGDHHRHKEDHHGNKDNHHEHRNAHSNQLDNPQHKAAQKEVKDRKTSAKRTWKKPSGLAPSDPDPCKILKCKRRHLCVENAETGEVECVHKKLLRQRQKQAKSSNENKKQKAEPKSPKEKTLKTTKGARNTKKDRSHKGKSKKRNSLSKSNPKRFHRFVTKMKNKAEHYRSTYTEKKRHELHQIRQLAHANSEVSPVHPHGHLKDGENYKVNPHEVSSPPTPTDQYCSTKELSEMSRRLLDWFKVLQDENNHDRDHVIQKRNSMKKELHEQDECICQAPVRYEFLNLDRDDDGVLASDELDNIESNGYEHCVRPFVKSCDHDADGQLSNKEWCCCFADVMPPCLALMTKIPATVSSGAPAVMPGARVPQCDSDGFYKPLQCHSSTGYCWCVDRNGVTIPGTNTRGTLDCEDLNLSENGPISEEESLKDV